MTHAKAEWALYCDESGNTGKNFGDRAQPVFVEAGWYVCHDKTTTLADKFEQVEHREGYTKKEVKGAKLLKTNFRWLTKWCLGPPTPPFHSLAHNYELAPAMNHRFVALNLRTGRRLKTNPRPIWMFGKPRLPVFCATYSLRSPFSTVRIKPNSPCSSSASPAVK
jgi:hypothetical protein